MKYTELTISKTGKDEFVLTISVHQSFPSGILQTIAKDDFYMAYEELRSYLLSLAFVDSNVRSAARSSVFKHRCRTAKRGNLVLSLRWDGSYLDELKRSNAEHDAGGTQSPWTVEWELLPFSFKLDESITAYRREAIERAGGFVLDDSSYIDEHGEIHEVKGGGLSGNAQVHFGSDDGEDQ